MIGKRLLAGAFAALLLLCACGRTTDDGSGAPQTTSVGEGETDFYDLTFPVSCLTSLTNDELLARATGGNERYCERLSGLLDTPLCIYGQRHSAADGHTGYFAYDKRTGAFSDACRDPLCDHTSCLWGRLTGASYVVRGRDGLLFVEVREEPGQFADDVYGGSYQFCRTTIYDADFQGNAVRKLYETAGSAEGLQQVGDYLWFDLVTWSDETADVQEEYVRLQPESGQAETVLRKGETPFGWIFPLENGTQVFYETAAEDEEGQLFSSVYLYDAETGESTVFLDDPTGAHAYTINALQDHAIYYTDTVRAERTCRVYRRAGDGFGEETPVLEKEQGVRTVWAVDGMYQMRTTDTGCVLYREGEEPYAVDVGYRVISHALDGDLLLCDYSVRETGSSGEEHWLLIDRKTGERLDVVVP